METGIACSWASVTSTAPEAGSTVSLAALARLIASCMGVWSATLSTSETIRVVSTENDAGG
eukprot:1984714-Prymnesium_polylepis.2